jgi:hypothetical protein
MHLRALLTTGVLLFACGAARAQDYPGLLHRLTKSVSYEASPGDLILVAVPADFLAGPDNPAARLKVEIEGTGLSKKPYVVRTLPTPRTPKVPGEIQAYVPVEGPGSATLTVTPISGKDKAGKPLVIKVSVAADAPG